MPERNEYRHDLFITDLTKILPDLEATYEEIVRTTPITLTLYFYDRESGPPNVDMNFRLRAYADLDPHTATLHDLKKLDWRVEKKTDHVKQEVAELTGLASTGDQEAYEILHVTHQAHSVKVATRRHFSMLREECEDHRLTVDTSRAVFDVDGHQLRFLADIGPRVEVKVPTNEDESSFQLKEELQRLSTWGPYRTLGPCLEELVREGFPASTREPFGEVEIKNEVIADKPSDVFYQILSALQNVQGDELKFVLPYPYMYSRVRRYHVCTGPESDATYTVVETPAGRFSLKVKRKARSTGEVLVRNTEASHTTDHDGEITTIDAYLREQGLTKLDAFVKTQLKTPVVLANGIGVQITLDQCVSEKGRKLNQLELEFMGSTQGIPSGTEEVMAAMNYVQSLIQHSPAGTSLSPTIVQKWYYFAESQSAETGR